MSISSYEHTTNSWWKPLKRRLLILYLSAGLLLLVLSGVGQARLLSEVGRPFGGFIWAIDSEGKAVVVSTFADLPPFPGEPSSLTVTETITRINGQDPSNLSTLYQHSHPGEKLTYTTSQNGKINTFDYPAATFTLSMWLQNYGLALLAGICWLLVGAALLATARAWIGAVEGITMLPPAMLFLLSSYWGNVQTSYSESIVVQFLWIPAFALLGAAFIHLSLTYRPAALSRSLALRDPAGPREPAVKTDALPYLPLIALVTFNVSVFVMHGVVPMRLEFILCLGYAFFGGILSFGIGAFSLLRISPLFPRFQVSAHIRRYVGDLLALWIGAVGIGFCLGILPLLLTGKLLLPLSIFYVLGAIYPIILLYAIRSLRLVDRLQRSVEQTEEALRQQQQTAEELRQANTELQRATSLLLSADAHLRSLLSERIHDQPRQQALRIRSLLGHWQHKLKVEIEHDLSLKTFAQPIIDALGKVRKISEELEGDLRGLQLLVEDTYQRRSLGLKLHLEKLMREDLPALHPESLLRMQMDLWALDNLSQDLEQTPAGEKFAEAVSYAITQALLNVYNHAGASYALVRTARTNGQLEVYIIDDGRGFDTHNIPPEKTSLFKAELKAREAGGTLIVQSIPRPLARHGTTVMLRLPFPEDRLPLDSGKLPGYRMQQNDGSKNQNVF